MKKIIIITAILLVNIINAQNSIYNKSGVFESDEQLNNITCGDIYNNGNVTIAVGTDNSRIIFLNWSNANFTIIDTLFLPFTTSLQVAVNDIDNDNLNELIVTGYDNWAYTGSLIIYQYYQSGFVVEWDTSGLYLPTYAINNLDDDNNKELVLCNYEVNPDANLMIISCEDMGYHLDFSVIMVDQWGYSSIHHPTIGDFNGDGNNEIAVSNDNGFTWLFGFDGSSYTQLNLLGPNNGGACRVISGNVDQDLKDELLIGTNGGLIQVLSHSSNWDFIEDWGEDIGRLAYRISVNNIDNDLESEFAVIHSKTDSYEDGQISLFNKITQGFELIWSDFLGYGWNSLLLYNVDIDPYIELLCTVNDSLIIYEPFTTGVSEYSIAKAAIIYPNPSSYKITISLPTIKGNTQLSISNVSGEKVLEKHLTENETQIDISALPRGVYFVKVQDEKIVEVVKMIKQ